MCEFPLKAPDAVMGEKTRKKTWWIPVMIFSLAGLMTGAIFSSINTAQAQEIGFTEVQGMVISIERGTIVVQSDQTGKIYTFSVGRGTRYIPRRYPTSGETVKVHYIDHKGSLIATQVNIGQQTQARRANQVQGMVISIERGTIVVQSDQTGKIYTFSVGRGTRYIPRRYPTSGETVKVHYIEHKGSLTATQVDIVPGS